MAPFDRNCVCSFSEVFLPLGQNEIKPTKQGIALHIQFRLEVNLIYGMSLHEDVCFTTLKQDGIIYDSHVGYVTIAITVTTSTVTRRRQTYRQLDGEVDGWMEGRRTCCP